MAILFPAQQGLQQRALASPPWRYLAGLGCRPAPEYGLGLDFWPGLLRDGFRSHPGVMGAVWVTVVALLLGLTLAGAALWQGRAPASAPGGAGAPGLPGAAERESPPAARRAEQPAEQPPALEQPA